MKGERQKARREMKKVFSKLIAAALILVLTFSLVLTGCGNSGGAASSSAAKSSAAASSSEDRRLCLPSDQTAPRCIASKDKTFR